MTTRWPCSAEPAGLFVAYEIVDHGQVVHRAWRWVRPGQTGALCRAVRDLVTDEAIARAWQRGQQATQAAAWADAAEGLAHP